jgi:hypothetical protein
MDGVHETVCSPGTQERKRRDRKMDCADLDTVHVQENRFADVELPKARELI